MKRNVLFIFLVSTLVLVGCWQASVPIPDAVGLYAYTQCTEDINSFYVIGGADEWDHPLDHFLRFDASQGIWYRLAPLPTPTSAAAASCYDGHIYVVTPEQNLYIYDIVAETWTSGSQPPHPAWGAAIGIWNGKLYLVGGAPTEWQMPSNLVDVYDLESDSWTIDDFTNVPIATSLPGYVQVGPYLYLAGGFGTQSPAQNVDATQRYDMSSNTWELGPTFTSARAAFSLSLQGYRLFAIGGDANGGTYLDETADIESLDLNGWNDGSWVGDQPALPQARMFTAGGFCTESEVGGEIWSVGGALPNEANLNALIEILYRDPYYRQDGNHSIWQEAMRIPPELFSEATNSVGSLGYLQGQQGVATNGNCYTGEFNLSVGAISPEEAGLPGEIVTYSLVLTNTGDIPDIWDIVISSGWLTEISTPEPIWPNMSDSLTVTVTIPMEAPPFAQDTATFTFTSQGDPSIIRSLDLVTHRDTGIDLLPPDSADSGAPGSSKTYPLTLINGTGQADSFDLELGAHNWETSLSSDEIGPIPVGETEIFTVTVNIPPDVPWYSQDEVTVTALSQADPGQYYGTSQITTTAYVPPELSFSPQTLESIQFPGEAVTQTLTISNGNGVTLTYAIIPGALSDDFSSDTTLWEYTYDSYRDVDEEFIVLTPLVNSQIGIVWLEQKISQPFTVEFRYKVGGGEPAGDGFVFMFYKNSDYIPSGEGSCLGFGGSDPYCAAEGYGIEFDGFNYGNNDPSDHHIALIKDNVSTHLASVDDFRVKDNQWHKVKILINETGLIMFLDEDEILTWEGEFDHTYSDLGFSAATAAALNWHIIDDFWLSFEGGTSTWLRTEPISGTLSTNNSQPIKVTFDSTSLIPATYTSTISILSNNPLNPLAQIPVTMTVEPSLSIGWVEGVVTDMHSGEPLGATIVAEGQPYTMTSDTETGYYRMWLEEGSYNLGISAQGYVSQTVTVDITAQQGVIQDFSLLLDAPWLGYSPESFNVTQMTGQVTTETLMLSNTGNAHLDFYLGDGYPGPVLLLHMDEPLGATTFHDSSGNNHHGSCTTPGCPTRQDPGRFGSAVNFDGEDDAITLGTWFNLQSFTIAMWVKEDESPQVECADIVDNYHYGGRSWVIQKCWGDNPTDKYYFHVANNETLIQFGLTSGVWQFLVVTVDESNFVSNVYVDGNLVGTATGSSPIYYDGSQFLQLGNWGGGGRYWNGSMDEVMIIDRTLTAEDVDMLYRSIYSGYSSWLSLDPISGTLAINETLPAQVVFNAINLQPDTYTTTLYISSNDPINSLVEVPVTMTVEPTHSMGWVEGIVSDLRTGEPLEATIVAEGQPYTVTSDLETGYYRLWLEPGWYNLQVSAAGYIDQFASVHVRNRQGETQNFALLLDAPWLGYSPESLESTQEIGQVTTQTITLSNAGTIPLDFFLGEGNPSSILTLHLDEPEGSTTFHDSSGNNYHGFCSPPGCPSAEIPGKYGSAVTFDGTDDSIDLGNWFDLQSFTIAMWVKAGVSQMGNADIMDNNHDSVRSWVIQQVGSGSPATSHYFCINGVGIIQFNLNPDVWQYLVITVDETSYVSNVYLDGVLVGTATGSSPITYDGTQFLRLGHWGSGGRYWNGSMDEVMIFDQAFTSDQIQELYQSRYWGNPTWLSVDPISGTVPINGIFPVQIGFDAANLQPGTYTNTLIISSNDPFKPLVNVPVTMTVTAPAWYGTLSGTVSSPGYCDNSPGVLAGAEILIESSMGVTWTVTTDGNGYYSYWLDENSSPYTVSASRPGYETVITSGVSITGGQTTPIDFSLRWLVPCLDSSPEQLPITLQMGQTATLPLVLTNTGAAPASFEFIERDAGPTIPILGAAVELAIPAGPDAAPDGSAVAAGPYMPRQKSTHLIQPHAILVDPPQVLLLQADDADGQWIRDQLLAYGDLGIVDSFNAGLDTPTLDELTTYDVVLTWSNYPYADPEGIGDVLADYVDSGGYVINLMYALGEHGWEMEGRFMDEAYNAIQGGLVKYETSCLGDHQPTHFIFIGVDEVCEFYRLNDTSLTPGSTVIARWQDGEIFVARNLDRSVITITGYVGYYYRWTGQMNQVVHNAILWFILGDDIPWLETVPISGMVPADGGIVNTDVIFDTTGYQPGEFYADLLLFSNDLVKSPIQVPVSLNIIPTPTMGWVEGIITDLRTGEPVEATIIAEGQPYSVTSNLETGFYKMWLEQGSYSLAVSAPGYVTQTAEVEIITQAGSLQDFSLLLDAAWLQYDPVEFEITTGVNQVITRTLTLTNAGSNSLEFVFGEGITSSILILHLDEPAGATTFYDTSGYGNNASCIGNSCPIAGVDGVSGNSLDFDGINDYLSIPHNPEIDHIEDLDRITYVTWINIQGWPSGYFPLLDVYKADIDIGWGFEMDQGAIGFFTYQGFGPSCGHNLQLNTWNHVAITYDRQMGVLNYYINGRVVCSFSLNIDIPDTFSDPLYIGLSKSGADEYSAGLFDEVLVFDRTLTPDEIRMLYEGQNPQFVDWLRIHPMSGTVPTDGSQPVQVTFNASGQLPDTYTTTLYLTSNDPLLPVAEIPITMIVSGEVTPTAVIIDGVEQGWIGKEYSFTATVSPETALTPITYVWQVDDQIPITHTAGVVDTISFTWDTAGDRSIHVTASNTYGVVSDTHSMSIEEIPYTYYFPLMFKDTQLSPDMGWVHGVVTDLRTGSPLQAIVRTVGLPYSTTSNADTGYYQLWLEHGSYTLRASAPGYVSDSQQVIITAEQWTESDFELMPNTPWMGYSPESFSEILETGQVLNQDLTIANAGTVPLEFEINEPINNPLMWLHLDEPAGATAFYDHSGNGNNGLCSNPYCPIAGEAGRFGGAVRFDGIDDYIQLPELTNGLPEGSISLWAKVFSWNPGYGGMYYFSAMAHPPHSGDSWDLINLGAHPETGNIDLRFGRAGGGSWNWASSGTIPELDEWYHIVGTWGADGNKIYINGILAGSNPYHEPASFQSVMDALGCSSWPDSFIDGLIDEVAFFDRTLSPEEVVILYQGGYLVPDWLTVNPSSGTIPVNTSISVQVTFDGTNLQPDIYTTNLNIASNDPLLPLVEIPVTLAIDPTSSMGWVEGIVTDLRTGEPLQGTIIAEGQPYSVVSDFQTGYYKLWLEPGTYSLNASAMGYVTQTVEVVVSTQVRTLQDMALLLDAPILQYSPHEFEVTVGTNQVITHSLTITNSGTTELGFQVAGDLSEVTLLLHLDEPTGATTFYDSSGYENHGTCYGDTCPDAGLPGILGNAVKFDGNDFITIPDSLQLNPTEAVSFNVWIYPYDWNSNRRILQKGEGDNQYIFGCKGGDGGTFVLMLFGVGELETNLPTPNAWHHVVGLYDGSFMQIWVDGQLVAEKPVSGQIATTNDPLYIGTKHVGAPPSDYFNGLMDELMIFNRALSEAEIQALYAGWSPGEHLWLSVEPSFGSVQPGNTHTIQVIFNAIELQPDTYTTTLFLISNDPLLPLVEIPVTMTVTEEMQPTKKTSPMVKTGWFPSGMVGLIPLIPLLRPRWRNYLEVR